MNEGPLYASPSPFVTDQMFVSPKIHMLKSQPPMGGKLDHKGQAFMNAVSDPVRDLTELPHPFYGKL